MAITINGRVFRSKKACKKYYSSLRRGARSLGLYKEDEDDVVDLYAAYAGIEVTDARRLIQSVELTEHITGSEHPRIIFLNGAPLDFSIRKDKIFSGK